MNLGQDGTRAVHAGMRKEHFVDGRPHENRSVILSVLALSHPLDVPMYDGGNAISPQHSA
jgi:hypothetical protein